MTSLFRSIAPFVVAMIACTPKAAKDSGSDLASVQLRLPSDLVIDEYSSTLSIQNQSNAETQRFSLLEVKEQSFRPGEYLLSLELRDAKGPIGASVPKKEACPPLLTRIVAGPNKLAMVVCRADTLEPIMPAPDRGSLDVDVTVVDPNRAAAYTPIAIQEFIAEGKVALIAFNKLNSNALLDAMSARFTRDSQWRLTIVPNTVESSFLQQAIYFSDESIPGRGLVSINCSYNPTNHRPYAVPSVGQPVDVLGRVLSLSLSRDRVGLLMSCDLNR